VTRPTRREAASPDVHEILARLPRATAIFKAGSGSFTPTAPDAETILTPIGLESVPAPAGPALLPVEPALGDAGAIQPAPATVPPAPNAAGPVTTTNDLTAATIGAIESAAVNATGVATARAVGPAASAPPVEPEQIPPAEAPPGVAPVSPTPLAPATPTPEHPQPDSPVPVSPAPGHPVPDLPVPVSPAPGHPVPEAPGPVSPAPGGTVSGLDDLPSAESISAEVSAELSAQAQPAPRRPEAGEWRGIVLVTGTDTEVGKTIVTAAVAAAAQAAGLRVAVVKPGQTGIATGEPTDIEVITRLAAPDTTRTLAEYPDPLAPLTAATVASLPPLELYEVVDAIRAEADKHDLVLVEGAGGLLVPMGVRPSGDSWTVADLATTLGVSTIVVARAGLGTLNHTALTLEALARRGVPAGVVIGAWPHDPELVHWANLSELVPHLIGALPSGAGDMDPGVFRRSAPGWLTPSLYGVLDNWRVWAEEFGEGHH
jgi:dethiobiotin synthetase